MKNLVLLVLLSITLIACQPPLAQGYITNKNFTPAHSTTIWVPQYTTTCSTFNNITTCRQQLLYFLPITTHHPDKWSIYVENGDREEWITITEPEWNMLHIDEFWVRPSPTP